MPIIADVYASDGPTLDQVITEVITAAQGFGIAPDRTLALAASITDADLTMVVTGAESPGLYEVDNELVYVTAVDAASGTCTVHPSGRGWINSVAEAHTAGAVVTEAPVLPRARVAVMVNDVISGLYPVLYGIDTATGTDYDGYPIEMPTDAEFVLDVQSTVDELEWGRVRSWEPQMNHATGATGKVLELPRTADGATVRVTYGKRPGRFATGDQYWSDTGLPLGVKDVVVLGALAKFAQTLDLGRLTDRFSTPKGDAQQPQLGAGVAIARQLKADYQAALEREATALRNLYPVRSHFVR